jgi:ferredoxin
MSNYKKLTKFDIRVDRETAFHLMDCYPNSTIYDEMVEAFQKLEEPLLQCISPAAYLKTGKITEQEAAHSAGRLAAGTPVVYVLLTVGDGAVDFSSQYFKTGRYLLGILTDAMADSYLFQMDDVVKSYIKGGGMGRHSNLSGKIEAPDHVPMIMQKDILDKINEAQPLDIGITESYMYTPIKTMGSILLLTKDSIVKTERSCDTCGRKEKCSLRQFDDPRITVIGRGKPILFPCRTDSSLLDAMILHGIYISADCGGRGSCGKCKIKVLEGNLEITDYDRSVFTKEQLEQGYRIACKAHPKGNCTIALTAFDESDFET